MATRRKPVNLALQGGGAHGAFTWGVLDRILEDGRLEIAGISGTSAGAMNAVALADGFTRDGPQGARAALDHFWQCMSESAKFSPLRRTPIDVLMGNWGLENNPAYHAMDALSRVASPYQLNPMNTNPLRDLVEESIDFASVRACTAFELFISATNVETGKVKVFPAKR
jgi:NTE family protein